jgi:hypothetical protein
VRHSVIRRVMRALMEDIWRICCELTNNKNSTVIKLGTYTAIGLCHLKEKCYVVKVFIVECNLSMKFKNTNFRTFVYINFFFLF